MTPSLLSIALATLLSEDLTCIAAGVLIAQHRLGLVEGTAACTAGILAGDLLLFLAGRFAGHSTLLRWVPENKVRAASEWISRRGLAVVLVSRFTPGLRLPTYVAAGLLHSRFWSFAAYFLLAAVLWTPLLVAGTAALGEHALHGVLSRASPVAVIAIAAVVLAALRLRDFEARRRLAGFWKRKLRWEFWPAWAVYLPLIPYLFYLAVRYRSLTLFTAANPGIPTGGLLGESKCDILRLLSRVEGVVPDFSLIPAAAGLEIRIALARRFIADRGLAFPVVLKPDVGERGSGVVIAQNGADVELYFRGATADTILQAYAPGQEFGVYYVRYPDEVRGRTLYVTQKHFPAVSGDGATSLRHLILKDARAVCLADSYFGAARRSLDDIPALGEPVPLVDIGSHCRGAVFIDGSHLITPALAAAVDRVSRAHPGFHLGRYDVRAASPEALSRGEFQVIELNGVAAEATHIYDPAVSLVEAYRVMARHWRTAFEIGDVNRARGCAPLRVPDLWRLLFRGRLSRILCPRLT